MGYAENCLPKALAALGHDVHLVTSTAQVYCDAPFYETTYAPFLGPRFVEPGTKRVAGYTMHRLPFAKMGRQKRIKGLVRKLAELKPDIVQTFDAASQPTLEIAAAQPFIGFRLFLGAHVHASVLSGGLKLSALRRLKWWSARWLFGPFVSSRADLCYPISSDTATVAQTQFGVPVEKIKVESLGVDCDLFHPPVTDADLRLREESRAALGFGPNDIVCIYTGRFGPDKDPICLAKAIDHLMDSHPNVRGLFIGDGEESRQIGQYRGCVVLPFVQAHELLRFYWASDIGVWPRQESTSQLDAAACGLPLILSDRIHVRERVDGNGLLYAEGDFQALAQQIAVLTDSDARSQLGRVGRDKMEQRFSWRQLAERRAQDYLTASSRS